MTETTGAVEKTASAAGSESTAGSLPADTISGSSSLTSGETPSSFTRIYHPDLSPAAGRKKLRVAAYCRVSTDLDEQKTSFDEQVAAYTDMITSNPDWDLAAIYADEGVTGTSASKRPRFRQMIRDCEAGLIDLIITKSISRFARNTLECLSYVRYLQSLGVNLVFENNHLDTRAAYSEMLLTVLAAFAQEESRSISENTIWGIRKRYESGISRWSRLYGYTRTDEGRYRIIPDQAETVQTIFRLYEHGHTIREIISRLADRHIPSPSGRPKWNSSAIHEMLCNERYAGDIRLQKYYVENHITHRAIRNVNSDTVPSYYIRDHHTPIIPRSQFDRCQRIMALRSSRKPGADVCNQYPFGNKLRCPFCGSVLYQRTVPVQSRHTTGWCCEQGDSACRRFIIRSRPVEKALLDAYQALELGDLQKLLPDMQKKPTGHSSLSELNNEEHLQLAIQIKEDHPRFSRVDYWWVDDMIDRIEFAAVSPLTATTSELHQNIPGAVSNQSPEQTSYTMTVYWRCGLTTTVPAGITSHRDDPVYIAGLYAAMLERNRTNKRGTGTNHVSEQSSKPQL